MRAVGRAVTNPIGGAPLFLRRRECRDMNSSLIGGAPLFLRRRECRDVKK